MFLERRSFPPPLNLFGEPWSPAMAVRRIYGAGTGTAENDRKGVHIEIKNCLLVSSCPKVLSLFHQQKEKTKKKKQPRNVMLVASSFFFLNFSVLGARR